MSQVARSKLIITTLQNAAGPEYFCGHQSKFLARYMSPEESIIHDIISFRSVSVYKMCPVVTWSQTPC